MKQAIKRVVKEILNKVSVNRVSGLEDVTFLTSQGRSGSTLVSRLITSGGNFRNHHEPFNKAFVAEVEPFEYGRYIPKSANLNQEKNIVSKVLSGKIYNHWIGMGTLSFFYKKRLIKAIRANLFTPWLKNNFSEIKLVVLIRNPFAVAESWINVNFGNGKRLLQTIKDQPSLVDSLPKEAQKQITQEMSLKERLIFNWCVEYYMLFKDLNPSEYKLLVYERLLEDSEKEMKELLGFINVPYHDKWKIVLNKPSMTTSKNSLARTQPGKLHEKWRTSWTEDEIARGRNIMGLFGFQDVYANSFPNKVQFTSLFSK